MNILKYVGCVFFMAVWGCAKENKELPTQLQLKVADKNGDLVSGARVYLYNTESDWVNGTNYAYSFYTDSKGEALLVNLDAKRYYIYVVYNCLQNKVVTNTDYTIAVSPNTTTLKNIQLYGAGGMSFRNNYTTVTIQYSVSKNNSLIASYNVAPLGQTPVFIFEDGFYDVSVKNLANGVVTNFIKTYLNCGGSIPFSFP
ncbi:carboxypeptidase-like regulatory domain-containing protein [Niabella drilacis]|uniref:Carboxypeptidase regulatory-like domain-containing protein n=1 Tax=Niabella drilacis (strain DSM 25811 / CCM 8410 / CCUG 62505 / LMG 26954 / E90) TaxID=1285928 RepID=A0A1G6RZN4_NIADE|nr:carboxypeptidase-like regulatory domain-containing protein [Niabella drilacis]SDD10028.1 hypothetical protein SAMN04487894_10623 [Niabella drilacis]